MAGSHNFLTNLLRTRTVECFYSYFELIISQGKHYNGVVLSTILIQIKYIIIIIICSTPNLSKAMNGKLTLPILLHNWHAILKVTYLYRSCECIKGVHNYMLYINKVLSKTLMLQQKEYNFATNGCSNLTISIIYYIMPTCTHNNGRDVMQ